MQHRRAGFYRFDHVEDRRQFFVLDVDEIDRFFRRVAALSSHRRDLVTDVAHFVPAKNRNIANAFALIMIRLVFARNDRFHARHLPRFSRVDPDDARMRIRTSENLTPQSVGEMHVGAVNRLAADLVRALHSPHRGADDRCWFRHIRFSSV